MDTPHHARAFAFALLALWIGAATAQEPTRLYPESQLPYADCPGFRCFEFGEELEGTRAVATNTAGRVLIYRAEGSTWVTEQVLRNPDIPPYDPNAYVEFGLQTALSGDALFVGGTSKKYQGRSVVYVYLRQNGVWRHTQVLALPLVDGYLPAHLGDIAIDGNVALVGSLRFTDNSPSPGVLSLVHVFVRDSTGRFQRRADLRTPTATQSEGGAQLALSGGLAVVADWGASGGRGAAYVYQQGSAGWPLRASLAPPTATGTENFGTDVDIEGTRIVIGAPGVANGVRPDIPGAVYVYERSGNTWVVNQTLTNPFATPGDPVIDARWYFGNHVSLSGDRVLVGTQAWGELSPFAYLFERRFNGWQPVGQLASVGQLFPGNVVVSGNKALVSASDPCCGVANYTYTLPLFGLLPVAGQ